MKIINSEDLKEKWQRIEVENNIKSKKLQCLGHELRDEKYQHLHSVLQWEIYGKNSTMC